MKIGILTLPLHSNYGGILQAFALQTVLERMGHEVVVFNCLQRLPSLDWKQIPKRLIKKIMGKGSVIFKETRRKKELPMLRKNLDSFMKEYVHICMTDSLTGLQKDCVDAIVVGSDQVWRPMYFKDMWRTSFEDAFLAFAKEWNVKRVSYAASFGVDCWELNPEETTSVKSLLSVFDGISVREKSGVAMIKDHLQSTAIQSIDPTMLLSQKDYEALFNKKNVVKSPGSLLVYILDKNKHKEKIIESIAKSKNLVPFFVNKSFVRENAPLKDRVLPSIESWLRGFYDAKFILTDSFHACVFAIIFNKPFYVIQNAERGNSRFDTLLTMFGLEHRLISVDSFDASKIEENIDFSRINELIGNQRLQSLKFLKDSLREDV